MINPKVEPMMAKPDKPQVYHIGWLLRLALFIVLSSLAINPAMAQPDRTISPIALVRIDLRSEAEIQQLAPLGLSVYAQLYTAEGEVILLIAADERTQLELSGRGYTPQVLDADTTGAAYCLLYGLPQTLQLAVAQTDILVIEGRQAVARGTLEQLSGLNSMGIKVHPLQPYRLKATNLPQVQSIPQVREIAPEAVIQGMIDQISEATLTSMVGDLSGEWPAIIGGSAYTLATRYTLADVPIKKATLYARERLQSYGLLNDFDYYTFYYYGTYEKRNVIAQQTGVKHPERIVMLTAHIDSYSGSSSSTLAPGADDNATGSAAVLLAAQILSQYQFDYTLRYALFTGEEIGLFGSRAYAEEVANLDENILAVLNLDMLGYNTLGTGKFIELHTRNGNANDLAIAYLFRDVIDAYNLNLIEEILPDGLSFSDHKPFWDNGYPAILAIEDWQDHTPYYHTTDDQLESLHISYYVDFVRASIATFAHMANPLDLSTYYLPALNK